ncbi:hypothetical protein SAMN04489724_2954 [Algoriphagus locisalis]|uniref:Uncharacterized protein n=1 Tax=Algoriphagus locisalis TaxID=305507 RepID=A0A1I7C8C3_9BACT|nr:hypothetical protein [Algoriphagus locisalis]SFT95645.1 hypothetical protein SAMN04489724_2954 [Algoriphagus locisalis]
MKNTLVITSLLISLATSAFAQTKNDVLYLDEGTKEVQVKEVGSNLIKYTYPEENTIYSVSKFQVKKILFASGREEIFESPFNQVKGLEDADKVYITYVPQETEGLESKGELFSKATGVTVFSSMHNVKNRSLDKMKAEAAMLGANVLLISDAQSRGNYYGNEYTPSQSTQTVLFGQAFTSNPINIPQVREMLEGVNYVLYQTFTLNRNDFSPKMKMSLEYNENRLPKFSKIEQIRERDGKLFVTTSGIRSKNNELEVINLQNGTITLMETHKNTVYNYILKTEKSDFMKSYESILSKN